MKRRSPVVLALVACAAFPCAAGAQGAQVTAYPQPGDSYAPPGSEISIRGIAPGQIGLVKVRGSKSGEKRLTVVAHSDGQGASFVPTRDFRRLETVTVTTGLDVRTAKDGDWTFKVSSPKSRGFGQSLAAQQPPKPRAALSFKSRRDLRPPRFQVTTNTAQSTNTLVAFSARAKDNSAQAGPMLTENTGELVWFNSLSRKGGQAAFDTKVQTYQGKPVITHFEGVAPVGQGMGQWAVYDQSYKRILTIRPGNGMSGDLHDLIITPKNTALLITYPSVGGPRGRTYTDNAIQELDLKTGRVLFEWHAMDHIPTSASYDPPAKRKTFTWDYFHANSVGEANDGNLLVSARNTWQLLKLDRVTGKTRWTVGGKKPSIKTGEGVGGNYQHDLRQLPDGTYTYFDNGSSPPIKKASRAVAFTVDEAAGTATLKSALTHPKKYLSATQGNSQVLGNGHTFVGWGSQSAATEYDPAGRIVWDGRWTAGWESYRSFRVQWTGIPRTPPALAAQRSGSSTDVYASWNGSTQVAKWDVLAGPSASSLAPVGGANRTGFETRIRIPGKPAFVAVRALAADGKVLRTSKAEKAVG